MKNQREIIFIATNPGNGGAICMTYFSRLATDCGATHKASLLAAP